jgi:hypothetical protein
MHGREFAALCLGIEWCAADAPRKLPSSVECRPQAQRALNPNEEGTRQ